MNLTRSVCLISFCFLRLTVSGQPLATRGHLTTLYFRLSDSKATQSRRSEVSRAVTVPLLFGGAGFYATTDNEWLDRYEVKEERDERLPHFHTHADNFLQYAPIVAVYGLNMAGIKGKHDFVDRTVILVKSEIIMGVLTYSLKKITAVPRPDTGSRTSMPSGHTAQAFAAATFVVKEYGDKSIWYSIGAYTVATGVGVMRVLNNRHWASDVLVGAGVGIFSTNLAYLTHQYKWGSHKSHPGGTVVIPAFERGAYALTVVHRFG